MTWLWWKPAFMMQYIYILSKNSIFIPLLEGSVSWPVLIGSGGMCGSRPSLLGSSGLDVLLNMTYIRRGKKRSLSTWSCKVDIHIKNRISMQDIARLINLITMGVWGWGMGCDKIFSEMDTLWFISMKKCHFNVMSKHRFSSVWSF